MLGLTFVKGRMWLTCFFLKALLQSEIKIRFLEFAGGFIYLGLYTFVYSEKKHSILIEVKEVHCKS